MDWKGERTVGSGGAVCRIDSCDSQIQFRRPKKKKNSKFEKEVHRMMRAPTAAASMAVEKKWVEAGMRKWRALFSFSFFFCCLFFLNRLPPPQPPPPSSSPPPPPSHLSKFSGRLQHWMSLFIFFNRIGLWFWSDVFLGFRVDLIWFEEQNKQAPCWSGGALSMEKKCKINK